MKRYYDSMNFLVNYIDFEKNLINVSDKQIKNNNSLNEIDYLTKNSNEVFPTDITFDELYETFLNGRDKLGKYTWEDTEDTLAALETKIWTVSGKVLKKHKISLSEDG